MVYENEMYNRYEKLRSEKNVTTSEVCRETNIDPATMSHWKQNLYTPKLDKLVRIADFFEVPLDYFIKH